MNAADRQRVKLALDQAKRERLRRAGTLNPCEQVEQLAQAGLACAVPSVTRYNQGRCRCRACTMLATEQRKDRRGRARLRVGSRA